MSETTRLGRGMVRLLEQLAPRPPDSPAWLGEGDLDIGPRDRRRLLELEDRGFLERTHRYVPIAATGQVHRWQAYRLTGSGWAALTQAPPAKPRGAVSPPPTLPLC
jgi:hypothetical protein